MPPKSVAPSETPVAAVPEHGSSIDHAFQQIRQLIVHGRLAPGSWIIETDLSSRLGMSRTPVRGALQWLQREGYVIEQKARLNSRMIVAPLTHEDAKELYSIVAHIEGLAGVNTAQLPREQRHEIVARIRGLNDQLLSLDTTERSGENIFDLDIEFHRIIVEAGAGPRLLQLHNAVKPQTERYWRLYASNIKGQLGVVAEEHDRIIRAIQAGEADETQNALIANWVNGSERIASVIALQGERGTW